MNSAAVIGRQLRQQQTGGRTSGPLVPPQQPGKGRPRTPSHNPQRPYSPAPASYHQYPSPHPAAHGGKDSKKKQQQPEEPRIRCTWHCFCVALKALSGGIVLLVAGTVMSVVGFVAEANHVKQQQVSGANVTEVGEHIRNLTFAGPVIMGLGGIVIVAALVLTFEVRDTLGVKVQPSKPDKPAVMADTANTANQGNNRKNTIASISSGLKSADAESAVQKGAVLAECESLPNNSGKPKPTALTLPLAVLSDLSHEPISGFSKDRLQETIHETVFSETASGSNGVPGTLSSAGSGRSAPQQQWDHIQSSLESKH
ncbi:hypothetical protein B4U80_00730 [Leptotrombidium deliense]|uniref:Uncharacterized protein n=1 Tax=Leptotrombidium deliense TaxID=299467 RepID=A0A443SUF4_9ACAR|nr:hypothetical protein B4U80_00730 [Leptotrombidium deliense]